MPTQNPRLTITLEPLLSEQLKRLSALTGNSQSKLIAEMLQGSTAVLERLIRVLEAAELAKGEIRGNVAKGMGRAQSRIESQLGLVLEDFDGLHQALSAGKTGRTFPARRPAPGTGNREGHEGRELVDAGVSTPLSNRGVRSDLRTTKSSNKSRG